MVGRGHCGCQVKQENQTGFLIGGIPQLSARVRTALARSLADRNPGRRRAQLSTEDNAGAAHLVSGETFHLRLEKCDAGVGRAIIVKQGDTRGYHK
jgi:hypothetical protein